MVTSILPPERIQATFFAFTSTLALNHRRRNRYSARALGNQFLLLNQSQNRRRCLVVADGHNIVDVFAAQFIRQVAGAFHGDAVRKGGNPRQGMRAVLFQRRFMLAAPAA